MVKSTSDNGRKAKDMVLVCLHKSPKINLLDSGEKVRKLGMDNIHHLAILSKDTSLKPFGKSIRLSAKLLLNTAMEMFTKAV